MRGQVIIVSGPPGSGKTSVAAALAAHPHTVDPGTTLGVHLESDVFYRFISAGFIAPHLAESHLQNTAVMDIVIDAAASYADAGYLVFWDQFADLGKFESHVVPTDGPLAEVVAQAAAVLDDSSPAGSPLRLSAEAWVDGES